MLTYPNIVRSEIKRSSRRLAKCWRITRPDAVQFLFTDNCAPLRVWLPGVTTPFDFAPAGGFNPSALKRESQGVPTDEEFRGVITSDYITIADLKAGRWDHSLVEEHLVSLRAPWAGPILSNKMWIDALTWDGEKWKASVSGIERFLQTVQGGEWGRLCRHDVFDQPDDEDAGACELDPDLFRAEDCAVDTVTDRRLFTATTASMSGPNDATDDWYQFGELVWTTGNNVGLKFEVGEYTGASRTIGINLACPEPIQFGDLFDMLPGCDKRYQTCRDKYNNAVNFGGFILVPGADALTRSAPS